ncbi:MAG: hypothetical protein UZ09_BCD002000227 [Bacteroidetes bacterium OLB9]|nr:MAG: hypothetical protein UZ09_BCD002000227 [Bacteroidetes bacterium OLB9]
MNFSLLFRKFKTLLKLLAGAVKYEFVIKKYKLPTILSIDETIDLVTKEKLSVARFGDSEYLYLTGKSDGLQKTNKNLSNDLKRAMLSRNPKLLVCLVDYEDIDDKTLMAKMSAKMFHARTISKYYHLLDQNYKYGNSNMTRFYIGRKDKSNSQILFNKCKKLWDQRDIIIFEGQFTRFGYGNDLFENANSVRRVICPSKGAYDVYDKIISYAQTFPKDLLIIFALGASATVAASDLTDVGYQVIDIGNLDIEYEWFLSGAQSAVPIAKKQVSEVADITSALDLKDKIYESQIIKKLI